MNIFRKSRLSKAVSVVLGVAMAVVFIGPATAEAAALTEAQISSILSLLTSFGADQAVINNVNASLRGQATSGSGSGSGSGAACGFTFTQNLSQGDSGAEVQNLQVFLNRDASTQVASTGVGSPGNETTFFGSLTRAAVIKWQNANAAQVLTPVGLSAGTGFWGPSSRAHANAVCSSSGSGSGSGSGTPPVPAGTGLTVSAAGQPANSLAPNSASRIPFTNFTLTAGNDGPVTITGVTVERTGLAADSNFSGVVLLDSAGTQLGIARTLNSNHQATVGEDVTIPAGTSRTFTIAGNRAATGNNGEVASFDVVSINTSATVSGSLPIRGASHTVNTSLSIGTVTMDVSSFDPNSAQTKEIGTSGVRVAGVRVTAGSVEAIRIRNIRWNQVGSAGSTDITNVVVVADGTTYPTTLSSDGKFYSANFGSGIVLPKGNNTDIYVKADVVGGAGRTVALDIKKTTDIYITGETFGFGMTPTANTTGAEATTTSTFSTDGDPFFDGALMTISAGTATTIGKSSTVPAQNIAVNVPNQPFGAFETNFKGEPVNISGMVLKVGSSTAGNDLTSVSVVDENGSVVAGPVDAASATGFVTFTDSITFPTGKHVYSVQGKVPTGATNGQTYTITVTPSDWTSPVGDTTGDTVDLSGFGAFTLNTMTVKAAALTISVSPTPVAQNIPSGVQDFAFANYQFDATASGEDVRFSSIPLNLIFNNMVVTEVTSCQLWDGTTPLNTGTNIVNPSGASDANQSFTFDNPLVIPKGTIKNVPLTCDLSSATSANDSLQWGIDGSASVSVTGVTSSQDVSETITASNGQLMTVQAGTLVASEDALSPSYAIVAAGTTGVTNGVINFRAENEEITIQRIGLQLTNTASSSAQDLVQVSLWDGATQVGSAVFTGSNTLATSTLSTPLVVPKDGDKDVTVKIDLASIGTSQPGTQGALIAVDIKTGGDSTQGLGSSGTTINATGSTSFAGTRVFKSYPVITKQSVPTSTLINGSMDLYRFSVSANPASGNGIGLYQMTLNFATSTGSVVSGTTTVTSVKVFAYTDSGFSSPVAGFTNGQIVSTLSTVNSGDTDATLSSVLQIPAGATYYFRVTGTVTLTAGTGTFSGSVTTRLGGDANYPLTEGTWSPHMAQAASTTAFTNANGNNFIWSPNATTTSSSTHGDWTNGFNVSGLPSDGSDAVTLSK